MTGYLPVGFEFAAELTYPSSEGTSSGLLNASAQLFGIVLTLGMGALMNKLGTFAANIAICVALLIGTVATAMIRGELLRQKASRGLYNAAATTLTINVPPSAQKPGDTNPEL